MKPLLLHQREIARTCLDKFIFEGSTNLHFKSFNVLWIYCPKNLPFYG